MVSLFFTNNSNQARLNYMHLEVATFFFFRSIKMAEAEPSTTECPICLECYENFGDHIPRLLPCSHTICELCLKNLLGISFLANKFNCSECRQEHRTNNGPKTFPENRYILAVITKKHTMAKRQGTS